MAAAGDRNVEELKRLVVHTLETNGVLGQIRAELRSNVYKVIDEDETRTAPPPHRPSAKLMNSPMGCLMAEIVAEFFEFYEFRHSLSVFMPESNLGRNERRSRDQVAIDAGLDPRAPRLADSSILEQLVGLATNSSEMRKGGTDCRGDDWHSSASSTTASSPPPSSAPAAAARLVQSTEAAIPVLSAAPRTDSDASPQGGKHNDRASASVASASAASPPGAHRGHGSGDLAASAASHDDHEEASPDRKQDASNLSVGSVTSENLTQGSIHDDDEAKSRKPKRKQLLPSLNVSKDMLSGSPTVGAGQLPPLKIPASPPSVSGASEKDVQEEVSLSESSVGVSRESCEEVRDEVLRLDRRLARFPGRPTGPGIGAVVPALSPSMASATGESPTGGLQSSGSPIGAISGNTGIRDFNSSLLSDSGDKAPEVSANDMSAMSAASVASAGSQVSQGNPIRPLPRSAGSSPANSSQVVESPLRSPPLSPQSSQHNSSASMNSPIAGKSGQSPAAVSPAHSASLNSSGSAIPEDVNAQNESISIDESSGDGDIDLALGGTERSTILSSNVPGGAQEGGYPKRSPALFPSTAATGGFQDEEVEESIDEDMSNNSHESFQSSEDPWKNGGDDKF